ncbi:beta-glucosidase [Burkholderia sp. 567]
MIYITCAQVALALKDSNVHIPNIRFPARFVVCACAIAAAACTTPPSGSTRQPFIGARSDSLIHVDGLVFKDLAHDGVLHPYGDWRLSAETRARDLTARMTLEEKAGTMMHGTAPSLGHAPVPGAGDRWDFDRLGNLIERSHVNSFITRLSGNPADLAREYNEAQAIAEHSRLGIPLTISSDPRNGFDYQAGASVAAGRFSQWPDPPGFAAIGDAGLVRQFADIARQEYGAIGIRMALSPQADLATEPRWGRIKGTFGEDPEMARRLVNAYILGFQGAHGIDDTSVATVVKHWVGYGASVNGYDGHNHYGRFTDLSTETLESHLTPFKGAFDAGVAAVMPTYSMPPKDLNVRGVEGPLEQVGAGFSRQMLTELLRGRFGFGGIILTDWGIVDDCDEVCLHGAAPGKKATPADIAMPWGVENLPKAERFLKALNAGVNQFGGIDDPTPIVELVKSGRLSETRLDASVTRILELKFKLGLFENPYVDPERASRVVGNAAFAEKAKETQARSLVLLENKGNFLPLRPSAQRVFLYHVDADAARRAGFKPVDKLEDADLAILRVTTPFERPHANYFFGARYNEGDLAFGESNPDYAAIEAVSRRVPTIVTVYLDRPAILANVRSKATALIGNFGVGDAALFDVLTGKLSPAGKLPFELPSSMAEVARQRPDVPHDTAHPLYPIGFGLVYER